jgi:hypothetical protein
MVAVLLLAACGQPQLPPAASAESIDRAVNNAEHELATAKSRTGDREGALVGA